MKKILIVDDAGLIRVRLKKIIEKNGWEVAGEAQNGKDAIQKYQDLKPDLIIIDIFMPEMDGINAIRQIKDIDPKSNIIILSGESREDIVKEAIVAGAKSFIVKPFIEEKVIETIKKVLS